MAAKASVFLSDVGIRREERNLNENLGSIKDQVSDEGIFCHFADGHDYCS